MKFTVLKDEITAAVSNLQRVVSTKSSVPALECILISANESGLEMYAYDLELGMSTVLPAQVEERGRAALPARMFSDIVRRTPDAHVTVTVDEKNIATIESGNSRFSIIAVAAEEFPEMPKVADGTAVELPGNLLKSMIRQTLYAVGQADAKPVMQGSLFQIENGVLDVVSIDGFRLAMRSEPVNFPEEVSFVVPGKTLSEVLKLLKDADDPVQLSAGRKHILFTIENYTVISSLLSGEFINYKSVIPPDGKTQVTVKTDEIIASVDRVSQVITDRLRSPVRCQFEDNEIRFLGTTAVGRASDRIPVEMSGETLEIGFNNRYLLDALRNTECDEVRLQLSGPLAPMTIHPKEGNSFLFLVLPVRLRSE